jgi:hypothetical protein
LSPRWPTRASDRADGFDLPGEHPLPNERLLVEHIRLAVAAATGLFRRLAICDSLGLQ